MLYICGTPIGNLEDMTFRLVNTLKDVDRIAAEDTRVTAKLIAHLGIKKPMISYHEHNRAARGEYIANLLTAGENIALVTDAGMPCISDPGADLVKLCVERGLDVTVIPGPTAVSSALALSGLDTARFFFEGFLPARGRAKRLNEIKDLQCTVVFYEAPHRISKTLSDIYEVFGNRRCAVARELTKKFEEVVRGRLGEISVLEKGEFVIVVEGATAMHEKLDVLAEVRHLENHGVERKEAMRQVAKRSGLTRREVYDIVSIQGRDSDA